MSKRKGNFCLTRLKLFSNALVDLIVFLHTERRLLDVEKAEKISLDGFDEAGYLAMWPETSGG